MTKRFDDEMLKEMAELAISHKFIFGWDAVRFYLKVLDNKNVDKKVVDFRENFPRVQQWLAECDLSDFEKRFCALFEVVFKATPEWQTAFHSDKLKRIVKGADAYEKEIASFKADNQVEK